MSSSETPGSSSSSGSGSFVAPTVEELDAVLSSYELLEVLGRGGMGAVYKARQYSLDRIVAIKVLPTMEDTDGIQFVERFRREAQAMAQLNHPNIVSVYSFGETSDGLLYIVMEYVEGTDLHGVIRTGEMTPDHVLSWAPQICEAIQYAHDAGIVHRDIKPANVFIENSGTVKIGDFGLAKVGGDHAATKLTMTNMAMGTPDYVAPEVLEWGVEPDHRADVYALGVMLYEMLTGSVPRGSWKSVSEKVPGLDPRFDEIIVKAMDPDQDSRTQSAGEVATALNEIIHGSQPVAVARQAAATHAFEVGKKKRSRAGLFIGAGIGVLALVAVAVYFIGGSQNPVEEGISVSSGSEQITTEMQPESEVQKVAEEKPRKTEVQSKGPLDPTGKPVDSVEVPDDSPANAVAKTEDQPKPPREVVPKEEPVTPSEMAESKEPVIAESEMPQLVENTTEIKVEAPVVALEKNPFTDLLEEYEAGYRRTILSEYEGTVSELNGKYVAAVERDQNRAAKVSGDLEEVLHYRTEMKRVQARGVLLPDDSGLPSGLANLRSAYRGQVYRLKSEHDARTANLLSPFRKRVVELAGEVEEIEVLNQMNVVMKEIEKSGFPFAAFPVALVPGATVSAPVEVAAVAAAPRPIGARELTPEQVRRDLPRGQVFGFGILSGTDAAPVPVDSRGKHTEMSDYRDIVAVERVGHWAHGLRINGEMVGFLKPVDEENRDIVEFSLGYHCALFLKSDRTVALAKENLERVPSGFDVGSIEDAVSVAGNGQVSAILRETGEVVIWMDQGGAQQFVELDIAQRKLTKIYSMDRFIFGEDESGRFYPVFPEQDSRVADQLNRIDGIKEVESRPRARHCLVLKENGEVKAVSSSPQGGAEMVPEGIGLATAVRVGLMMSAARLVDGSWRAWGHSNASAVIEKINTFGPEVKDISFNLFEENGNAAQVIWVK